MTLATSDFVVPIQRIVYRRPPLAEAVIEFYFDPQNVSWDDKRWDEIASALSQVLPSSAPVEVRNVTIELGHIRTTDPVQARRLTTDNGGFALTVAPTMLGVSMLPPRLPSGYPGWEQLQQIATQVLGLHKTVARSAPVQRIIVRYINKLPVIPGEFTLASFVSATCPLVPAILLGERNPFYFEISRALSATETEARHESVVLAAGVSDDKNTELTLRIDEVAFALSKPFDDAPTTCAELHDTAYRTFDAVFSAEVLRTFEPIEHSTMASL